MVDGFRDQLFRSEGFKMGVNYGWNKIRFPAPVPSGSRVRASLETVSVDDVGNGWYQLVQRWRVEVEGTEKPACVAESVVRLLA
jgi:acyl dehydratase